MVRIVEIIGVKGIIEKVLLITDVIGVKSPVVSAIDKVKKVIGCLLLLRRYLIRPDSNSSLKDRCFCISNSVYLAGFSSYSVLKRETAIIVRLSLFTYTP